MPKNRFPRRPRAKRGTSRERLPSKDRSSRRVRIEPKALKGDREGIVLRKASAALLWGQGAI